MASLQRFTFGLAAFLAGLAGVISVADPSSIALQKPRAGSTGRLWFFSFRESDVKGRRASPAGLH